MVIMNDDMLTFSFWADEAGISTIALKLLRGDIGIYEALNSPGIAYQKLQMLITFLSFKFLGPSEMTARLPSLIAFFIGAIIMFYISKKIGNIYSAILSTFLYLFSHLNLAYATQAKPYMLIQVLVLATLALSVRINEQKNIPTRYLFNILLIAILMSASYVHQVGALIWIFYLSFTLLSSEKLLLAWYRKIMSNNYLRTLTIGLLLILVFILYQTIRSYLLSAGLFKYNHFYQVLKLFGYKYLFITVCAFFGYVFTFDKHVRINLAILSYALVSIISASTIIYIFNIRYVYPLFGIMFLYFGIFWAKAGERYYPKKPWLIPLAVMFILYATGYKIVRYPQAYYNPNIDKYGDIQIANYKDFYGKLKKHFPNYKKLYIVNDTFDAESWYMGRYSNAYFMKFTPKPYKHHTADAMIYGSLEDFRKIMRENPRGLLIMEDWQSFLPEDVKEYAKKNLKLEFRIDSLREAPDDPWPLALYSWGFP